MRPEDLSSEAQGSLHRVGSGKACYLAFVPELLPPEIEYDVELIMLLSEADRSMGEYSGLLSAIPDSTILIQPLLREEAVMSSQIEGTQSRINDLYIFEAGVKEDNIPEDAKEVSNYVRALEYGLKRIETLPVSTRLMRELHRILLEGVRGQHAYLGEIRKTQNWIGRPGCTLNDADYVPPPPEKVQKCLSNLDEFINSDSRIPALIRLAMIHYQFEAIHPFVDGNGRIGRLLISILNTSWGLTSRPGLHLSGFFENHRQEYYGRLRSVSYEGNWTGWMEFFLKGVKSQSDRGKDKVLQMLKMKDTWIERTKGSTSSLPFLLLDKLFENPILTIPQAQEHIEVTYVSARRAIETLCKKSILEPLGESNYGKRFVARELLEIL